MQVKHGTIALILIQLFVISAIAGALSPTASATNNETNTTMSNPDFLAQSIDDNKSSRAGFVGGDMVKLYNKKGKPQEDALSDDAMSLAYVVTKPEEVVDPISPHVIPLDENDALFQRTVSIADYLNGLGFATSHSNLAFSLNSSHYSIGVSAYGPTNLFNNVFNTNFDLYYDKTVGYSTAQEITIPKPIREKVRSIEFPPQPELYSEAWPPPQNISYYRLSPNEDSATLMNTTVWSSHSVENVTGALEQLQTYGYNGTGVDVALIDSGFYFNSTTGRYHEFYEYYYSDLLQNRYFAYNSPNNDEIGHGTGIVSNLLAVAPGINLHVIKLYANPLNELQIALQINSDVVTCSWGYEEIKVHGWGDYYRSIEAAINALVDNGAIVLFAGGNGGITAWPASMPNVVGVGGVYVDEIGNLMASNYSSSFDSILYPDRHVPDFCGTVGQQPHGMLIEMPTQPGSLADQAYSDYDETGDKDGWLVASGTSSATPQVAGLAAIVKQLNSSITAAEFKNLVGETAIDVTTGYSANGDPAAESYDNATGYGYIDVYETVRELRPVRNINSSLSYATIQEAIDANETLNSHTIQVDAGTYYENVLVDKSLTFIGESQSTTIVDGNGAGITVNIQADNVSISGFTIRNGTNGIYVYYADYVSITDNTVVNNTNYGIHLRTSHDASVTGNTISNNSRGIRTYYANRANVTENTISDNGYGIQIWQGGSNTFYHNNLINNTIRQVYCFSASNTWNASYPSGGNHWSDYTGVDEYSGPNQDQPGSDGIGDTPYVINAQNTDNYPLMDMWP